MRRTKKEAQQTREDILKAATDLFSQKGVALTTLDQIAKRANVTRGAVYWHFKNKTEIFNALFEAMHMPFIEMIWNELDKNHPQPLDQLKQICIDVLVSLKEEPDKVAALKLFFRKCDYSGELEIYRQKHQAMKNDKLVLFSKFFDRAKTKGHLPKDADSQLLTLAMSAYLKGVLIEYLDSDDEEILNKVPKLMGIFFSKIK